MVTEQLAAEKKLIERAQHDPKAFGELYEHYYSKIFNYALRRTCDIDLALDITSLTFLKALKEIERFRWRGVPFSSWLYKIATNEIYSHYRKTKKSISLDCDQTLRKIDDFSIEALKAEEDLYRHEEFLLLHQKVAELPIHYQEVIVLRFFEKMKIKEICEILGKGEGTVKSLLHRGLQKLKEYME